MNRVTQCYTNTLWRNYAKKAYPPRPSVYIPGAVHTGVRQANVYAVSSTIPPKHLYINIRFSLDIYICKCKWVCVFLRSYVLVSALSKHWVSWADTRRNGVTTGLSGVLPHTSSPDNFRV